MAPKTPPVTIYLRQPAIFAAQHFSVADWKSIPGYVYTILRREIVSSIDLNPVQKVIHLHLGQNITLARQFGGVDHAHKQCASSLHTSAGVLNHAELHGSLGWLIANVRGSDKSRGKE